MTIDDIIKDMPSEKKKKFFEGYYKELEFWGNIKPNRKRRNKDNVRNRRKI